MPLKIPQHSEPSLNLIPMIDVMLQLLIFFMLGTKFVEMERKIPLEVPRVVDAGALTAAPERKVVNVYRDGQITLDGKSMSGIAELERQLREVRRQYADQAVLVRGDAQGQFQQVASVLNACKQAGIKELGIAVLPGRRAETRTK
jgi:biopolymer transport protein ExbD